MFKKIIVILVLLICVFNLIPQAASANQYYYDKKWNTHNEKVKLYFNNKQVFTDVPPLILNGRTLVPVRAFFERIGAEVYWEESTKKVTVKDSTYTVTLYIDKYESDVNGKKIIMDVPAKIITDSSGIARTLVPVRFISTQIGYEVSWDQKTYSVHLTEKKKPVTDTPVNTTPPTEEKNSAEIKSFSATDDAVTINTSEKSAPVISKMANPSRLILDFYGFTLKNGDGALKKSGNCFSNVRYANHPDYARIVFDITTEYTYELKISDSKCVVYLKSKESNSNSTPDKPNSSNDEETDERPGENSTQNNTANGQDTDRPSHDGGSGLVVIDPGHGGSDPGAIGYKDGEVYIRESDINLDISLKLYNILKEKGVNVSMTRTTDVYVGLKERAEYANNLNATLFICVHNNSATVSTANGSMVYYFTGASDADTKKAYGITSKELAAMIQKPLLEYGGRYDRKIADGSRFVVMYSTIMPAVLIECAFVSNPEEQELLNTDEFRQTLAEGISVGVLNGLKQTGKY